MVSNRAHRCATCFSVVQMLLVQRIYVHILGLSGTNRSLGSEQPYYFLPNMNTGMGRVRFVACEWKCFKRDTRFDDAQLVYELMLLCTNYTQPKRE